MYNQYLEKNLLVKVGVKFTVFLVLVAVIVEDPFFHKYVEGKGSRTLNICLFT